MWAYAIFETCTANVCAIGHRQYVQGIPYKAVAGGYGAHFKVYARAEEALEAQGVTEKCGVLTNVYVKSMNPDTGSATSFMLCGAADTEHIAGDLRAANGDFYSVAKGSKHRCRRTSAATPLAIRANNL